MNRTGVKRSEGRWHLGERADGSPIELPWIRWQGGAGPHLYIGLTIHGDEITGQASLWRVGAWLEQSALAGTVTAVPVQNPEGFNYNVRGIPGTTWDLNRSYPGDAGGGTAERITARLTAAAREADAAIDVHTAGWCMPYILLDPVADAGTSRRASPTRCRRPCSPPGARRSRSSSAATATSSGRRSRRGRSHCATPCGTSASCARSLSRCTTFRCTSGSVTTA
jgi:hypothetical protein